MRDLEFVTEPGGARRYRRSGVKTRDWDPPIPHAPGARMTAVTQTPSNDHTDDDDDYENGDKDEL